MHVSQLRRHRDLLKSEELFFDPKTKYLFWMKCDVGYVDENFVFRAGNVIDFNHCVSNGLSSDRACE